MTANDLASQIMASQAGKSGNGHDADPLGIDWTAVQRANAEAADPALVAALSAGTLSAEPSGEGLRTWAAHHLGIVDPLERAQDYSAKLSVLTGLYSAPQQLLDAAIAGARVELRSGQQGLPALTLPQLLAQAPERTAWVWFGYLAKGAISDLTAKPKVGKTRFVLELVAHLLRGDDYLGHLVERSRVLYLTEESRSTFVGAVRRAGILADGDAFHVLLRGGVRQLEFAQVCSLALTYCESNAIDVVIVDTVSDWAGMRGDDEQSSGVALATAASLRVLADAGLTVVTVRHEGKSKNPGADLSDRGRGSGAFAGAVDVLLNLRRASGRGHETRRELHAGGRFDDTPPAATIELEGGCYRLVSTNAEGVRREHELQILEVLPMGEAWALTEADIRERLDLGHTQASRALKSLVTSGVISTEKRSRVDGRGQESVYWRGEAEC